MKRQIALRIFTFLTLLAFMMSCDSDDSKKQNTENEEYGWSETMRGNDLEEIAWPDRSENYWEYTMDVTEYPNVGLRFKGTYPTNDTRFFNITVYNDNTTKRITSIEDFNVAPNEGSKNPFAATGVTGSNSFEVNVVPSETSASVKSTLSNVLEFPESTQKLSILLRIYFNSENHGADFGGVELPEIVFFDTKTGKEIGKAVRAESNYYNACKAIVASIPQLQSVPALVFTLAPDLMYSNGPTGYVTAANRLKTGEALMFRFIPPVFPENVSQNNDADVRYWSICVGDTVTRTPITLPDREIIKSDDGYVNFFIIEKQDPLLEAIKVKAAAMKINVIVWDGKTFGEPMMVFYRQMYIKEGYEYSVQKIPSYPPLNAAGLPDSSAEVKAENMAHITLGEHGPSGLKLQSGVILTDGFNYSYMRMPLTGY